MPVAKRNAESKTKATADFTRLDPPADISSIIHCIRLHGDDLVGCELGVFQAISFCAVLQACPNIKTMHGVDSWQPYSDYLKPDYDGKPAYTVSRSDIRKVRRWAFEHIERSGQQHKAVIHEKDSTDALADFKAASLDFIFIDTYMDYDQARSDLQAWYPKVKKGGIFAGHDWDSDRIQRAVNDFRRDSRITRPMSTFDNTWIWFK
ncbi:MAG TPA: class I SAM-dependent methyltransferase [Kofleriaceae bacterium]